MSEPVSGAEGKDEAKQGAETEVVEPAKTEAPGHDGGGPRTPAPEVAKLEAPAAEPVKAEEAAHEPVKAEEVAREPVKAEEAAHEPAKAEEAAHEPAKAEEAAHEPAKAEEHAPQPPKSGEVASEAPGAEEPAAEPPKVEEPPPEPPKVEEPPPPPPPPPAPTIVKVRPDHGPLTGGAGVVITGEAFVEGCTVLIGGIEAQAARTSETTLEVVTPPGAKKGMAELRVVNPDGQLAIYEDDFRYDPAPSLVGVEPACLSAEGGAVLTILGADFAQGCAVKIGDALVPSSWAHAGRLEAVSKKHDVGAATIVVENPDGQRVVRERGVRFAAPPHIAGVEPASGVTSGGTGVTLLGSGFEPGCIAMMAGAPLPETTFVSASEIRFVTPAHVVPEAVDVAVVNPTGLAHRRPGSFSYFKAPPRVVSVSPDRGPNAGGTELVVRGECFDEAAVAFVCGIAAKVAWRGPGEIVVTTPEVSRDGLVDVRVVNADDQAHTVEKVFLYVAPLPPPELRQVGPSRGSQLGGLQVALLGEHFAEGVTARFGGVPAAVRFLTGKELSATTPAFTGYGEVDVEVTNPDGASSLLPAAFTYEPKPAPEITGLAPASGPTTGGTRVLIEGKNFAPGAAVYVGREPPKDLVVKSATEIQIVTAARKMHGVVDVEVALPGAPKAVMKNGFRYDAVPAPVITSVSPTAGAVGGGTELTIAGKNFTKETAVLVDGKAPRAVKLVDASTLELKTPPGESGKLADVIVRNPDGKEAVQKRAFLYDPRYRG
jgi:hypothetical protein